MNLIKIDKDQLYIIDSERKEYFFHKDDPEKGRNYFDEIIVEYKGQEFIAFNIQKNTDIGIQFYKEIKDVQIGHKTAMLSSSKIRLILEDFPL